MIGARGFLEMMMKQAMRMALAVVAFGTMVVVGCKSKEAPQPTIVAVPAAPVPVIQPGVDAAAKASKQAVIAYTPSKHIYPEIAAGPADVAAALKQAKKEHKRVILDFGGDWCGDCQVLDIYFHQSPNEEIVAKNFIEVKVNIGREDANLDLAHKYGVPVTGVPALAVLNGDGSVVVAQDKEFSDMRYMQSSSLTDFLNKWKPADH